MTVIYRVHAVRRMFERSISEADVNKVLAEGDEIVSYPNDAPYPSRLLLGWRGVQPLHVVAAYNALDDEQIVITVYEPDPTLWEEGFRRKRL
ncbi:MAG: hypothetical protein RL020_1800 [Pseudomonadota bacterium]|jgi:Domain of unknown function (DUF4258)